MTDPRPFRPDWISPPGDTIIDLLDERGWSQAELAKRLGFTRKHINDLAKGRVAITADAALRLESVLGAPAGFWLAREAQYREALERRRVAADSQRQVEWLTSLPWADMVKFGWVKGHKMAGARVEEALRFFGVASVDAWQASYETPVAAFRASTKFEMKTGAVAAWLRSAERRATGIKCRPFDSRKFRDALEDIRDLTREQDPSKFVRALTERCAACGVAVVFMRTPRGCPASGATKWLDPKRAMLVLSLRYKSDDHLWFTFFHEAGHILLHGKKLLILEFNGSTSTDQQEEEANRFAREHLIPSTEAKRMRALARSGTPSPKEVEKFAHRVGVSPGIVVGRMQKEKLVPWSHLNDLKARFTWCETDSGEEE